MAQATCSVWKTVSYTHLVLASPTYNNGIYPAMLNLLHDMKALNLQNRTVAVIENGSWAPSSAKQVQALLAEMKQMKVLEPVVTIKSSLKEDKMCIRDSTAAGPPPAVGHWERECWP